MEKENISPQSLLLAWENKTLIKRALKKASVYRTYNDYEDLLHEGLITYAQLLDQFTGKSLSETSKLAHKKIFWKIDGELRKSQRRSELFLPTKGQEFELEESLSRKDWLALATELGQLNQVESLIFKEHFIHKRPLEILAQQYNFGLRTLSREKGELVGRMRTKLKR